jgi:hypothetical protein
MDREFFEKVLALSSSPKGRLVVILVALGLVILATRNESWSEQPTIGELIAKEWNAPHPLMKLLRPPQ